MLCLLIHYLGYERDFDDGLVGGRDFVDRELAEAASRQPIRFLNFLYANWSFISKESRDAIINGVSNNLAFRFGNLQPNQEWKSIEESDPINLVCLLLDEFERHPTHWWHSRAASHAIESCAYVIKDKKNAERLLFLAAGFTTLNEENPIKGENVRLIESGINMITGNIVEGLMILVNNFQNLDVTYPDLLVPTLNYFAEKGHPAIRALILRRLPYLQSKDTELGWKLFHLSMKNATGLWQYAESCLYYAYGKQFEKVAPLLTRIKNDGSGKDFEIWGRISALAAFRNHINITDLINDLEVVDSTEAWDGASSVWTHPENAKQHNEQCMSGIEAGLRRNTANAMIVAKNMVNFFRSENLIILPTDLLELFLMFLKKVVRKTDIIYLGLMNGLTQFHNMILRKLWLQSKFIFPILKIPDRICMTIKTILHN